MSFLPGIDKNQVPEKKAPSLWKLVGWEAEVCWSGGIGFLVACWTTNSDPDANWNQVYMLLDIKLILLGIAALILGSAFAICNVLIKTRNK